MALVAIESFDVRRTAADLTAYGWIPVGALSATGRTGNGWTQTGDTTNSYVLPGPARSIAGFGVAFKQSSGTSYSVTSWVGFGDSTGQPMMNIIFTAAGAVALRRNAVVVATSADGVLPPVNSWFFMELWTVTHDTAGYAEVRIDGATVLTFTGDTKPATPSDLSRVIFRRAGSGGLNIVYDDFYVVDDTGPRNTFLLGDVTIEALTPNNDAATDLMGSDGNSIDNYELVDELPVNVADYVEGDVVDDHDIYGFTDPITGRAIRGVQFNAFVWKTDTGARNAALVTRPVITIYAGADRALTTAGKWEAALSEINPETNAVWTEPELSVTRFGVRVR